MLNHLQMQTQVQYEVAAEDCKTGYRDPSRNPTASLAWDMSQIALAHRLCEGSMLAG
jgi:hypothetical protein